MLKVSGDVDIWIFVERRDVMASYAAVSAFSFLYPDNCNEQDVRNNKP